MTDNANDGKATCAICNTAPDPVTGLCLCAKNAVQQAAPAGFSSGALVAQAESLFETYLAARLVRARRNLTFAKVALLRDPRNRAKLEDLRRAETEAERLQAQLVEQARKAAQARNGHDRANGESREPGPETPISAEATEDFRTVQAVRAEEIYASSDVSLGRRSRQDDRDCPSCGRRVPGNEAACSCGHRFIAEADIAAEPFLTDEELAALRGETKLS